MMTNETDFLIKLKSGDKQAFTDMVAIYQKKVINICYRFLLNKEDAVDVSQEVFIEAYHSIRDFRGEAKLGTWIYRIAVSKSLDEIKKRNRKKRISSIGKTLGIEFISNLLVGNERPDKSMEENEGYSMLLKTLGKLPENQRIALTLSKIEDYTNSEVAEILEVSLTAVDSLIYRAKQNLKTILNQNPPEKK
jgi:RNA polymerase sigma-70 factor (ECF subfamily)